MGVSNKNAQDNIQPKGNKKDFKKPLQVLHISKKDTQKKSQDILNEQLNYQEEIKKENIAIKPQLIKNGSVNEIENSKINTNASDRSQQNLNGTIDFSEQSTEFQLERTVDEFDFDESEIVPGKPLCSGENPIY